MLFNFGTAITMLIQVGVSFFNQESNKKNTEKIRKIQRESKQLSQENSLRRDYERFIRSCQCQIEMENESRRERIASLNQNFLNSFKQMAHNATLADHYPLRISPYIIQRSVVPLVAEQLENTREELLCILTNSNEQRFNKDVLPYIDEMLCCNIAQHWNKGSMHNVCYYQGIWDSKKTFLDEDIDNIKAIICSPTLAITPYFINEQLYIKINFWGMGCSNNSIVKTGININSLLSNEIDKTLSLLKPILLCTIGLMVDFFYWTTNYQAPIFPTIVSKGLIKYNDDDILSIYNAYTELYRTFVLGNLENKNDIDQESKTLVKDIVDINQFNFPKRCISFLDSITEIPAVIPALHSGSLIFDSIQSIYKAKTDSDIESLSNIDVKLLDKKDIDLVNDLITISKKYNNVVITKELIDIIKRKILAWDK